MLRKPITVRIYTRDPFIARYLINLLKTDPNVLVVKPPSSAAATILQEDLLTPTERKFLQSLARHGTIAKVASILSYSPNTVKTYLSRIYAKLGVKTAPQAIAFAMHYGLIYFEGNEK